MRSSPGTRRGRSRMPVRPRMRVRRRASRRCGDVRARLGRGPRAGLRRPPRPPAAARAPRAESGVPPRVAPSRGVCGGGRARRPGAGRGSRRRLRPRARRRGHDGGRGLCDRARGGGAGRAPHASRARLGGQGAHGYGSAGRPLRARRRRDRRHRAPDRRVRSAGGGDPALCGERHDGSPGRRRTARPPPRRADHDPPRGERGGSGARPPPLSPASHLHHGVCGGRAPHLAHRGGACDPCRRRRSQAPRRPRHR